MARCTSYVGSENIYAQPPIVPVPIESPLEFGRPANAMGRQPSVIPQLSRTGSTFPVASNSCRWPAKIPCAITTTLPQPFKYATDCYRQAALASAIRRHFQSGNQHLTLYGNYGVLLSLGPQAPWWVDNASQFLAPFFTRQAEIGAKYEPGQRILITAAFYRMRAPFFYPKGIGLRTASARRANATHRVT